MIITENGSKIDSLHAKSVENGQKVWRAKVLKMAKNARQKCQIFENLHAKNAKNTPKHAKKVPFLG